MTSKPQVIAQIVDNDLCTGCGLCTYTCSSKALEMEFNDYGFLVPKLIGSCDANGDCISVCPFNPEPLEAVKDETAIANIFLTDKTENHEKLGNLIGTYAGHSNEFRDTSTSGGMATYIFDQLLEKGIVDHIFSVRSSEDVNSHYQYKIASNKNDLRDSSKTRYYPVTLATVFSKINQLNGKVAIIGIPCFVKAVRLVQYRDPHLKEKIPFVAGIVCGGLKSAFYTEYLASMAGVKSENIKSPEYRIKNISNDASDCSFGCLDKLSNSFETIEMRTLGDMWGTGFFKANACDFCDDVVAELADISFGDAWIQPYKSDWKGTNLVITRSPLAESLVNDGIKNSDIILEKINPELVRTSQEGSYNHRHDGLYVRINEAKRKEIPIPVKRYGFNKVSLDVLIIQKLRRLTRKKSLQIWKQSPSVVIFYREMKKTLFLLKVITKVTSLKRKIKKRFL